MNDRELEAGLQGWYRIEVGAVEAAPHDLRTAVLAIPGTERQGRRVGRGLTLLAAAALLLIGGAILVGSGLLRLPAPPRVYVNELTSAPDLPVIMARPALVPLLDGRVLVIGDDGDGGSQTTRALIYDPATGISVSTGPLSPDQGLWVEAAVRLTDGRVLVVADNGAQLFDPNTMQFTRTGPMVLPRSMAGVTALPDGRALIAGGYGIGAEGATSSAELFDPATMTWTPTGSMGTSRSMPSLAVLPDGRVFVSPGESRTTVETYDPRTGTFSWAGTMDDYGFGDAFALPDGRVAVFGGRSISSRGFVQVWDPATLTFSTIRQLQGRPRSEAALDDGRILIVGGEPANWAGVYDPALGATKLLRSTEGWQPRAVRLADGRVLIVGGLTDGNLRPEGGGTSAPGVSTVEVFQ